MRWSVLGLVSVWLAGCGGGMTEAERIQQCLNLFRDYDRALLLSAGNSEIVRRTIGTQVNAFDRTDIVVSGLRQFDCWTRLSRIPDLGETAARMQAFNAAGIGALTAPEYLHAGLVAGGRGERALKDFFTGLGYPVRTTGAPGLGRRVWVGPLDTVEARRGAEALASAAGLSTAYTVTRLPYPR
ncbi:MAG: hypothetical protein AAF281_15165 [Pseudomonadota bacterium]